MSLFKQKLEEASLQVTRSNPSYSCGILVDPKSVVGSLLNNPWVKATTSLNGFEMKKWAEDADMAKIGTAVIVRTPEGTDTKIILNPKISSGVYSDNSGKSSTGSTYGNNATEMEVVFAAGKNIAPTVVAQRSTYLPGSATMQANPDAAVPSMVGAVSEEGNLRKTANNTNAATGTVLKDNAFLDSLRGVFRNPFEKPAKPGSLLESIGGKSNPNAPLDPFGGSGFKMVSKS